MCDSIVECIPNDHPEIIEKHTKKKFVNEKEQEQWYKGIIYSYLLSDSSSRKRAVDSSEHSLSSNLLKRVCVSDSIVECIPNAHPEIIGKCAKMTFFGEKEQEQWYEGIISSHNVITGKYSVYFSYDGVTEIKRHHMMTKIWKLLTDD